MSAGVRLTVAIPTHRRPQQLSRALHAVLSQVRAWAAEGAGRDGQVLVVDNDSAGSARAVVTGLGAADVRYVVEPVAGIVAARNRALDETGDRDLLVFLDDDEQPRARWLETLVETHTRTGATAVMGRVVSRVPPDADPWILAGELFERPRMPTGSVLEVAATGNLLLDVRQVRELGVRFDRRFALSSGEDSFFSRQLVGRGGRLVFCDESVAEDEVEPDRITRTWLLARARSQGNATSRVELALREGRGERVRTRLVLLGRGTARVVGGSGRWAIGRVTGSPRHQARGARTQRRGIGMIAGALGTVHQEYARAS